MPISRDFRLWPARAPATRPGQRAVSVRQHRYWTIRANSSGSSDAAADEGAVDLGHRHQLGDVAGLHAPAVLDADGVGGGVVVASSRSAPRIDAAWSRRRPRGWRCDRCRWPRWARRRRRASAASAAFTPANAAGDLRGDPVGGGAGLALLERLPHAHDRRHAVLQHRLELLVDRLVGLAEQLAAFGVPDDHVAAR